MSNPAGEDKRAHRRVPLILQVEYPDREGYLADATENLSASGAFVRTSRALEVGARLPLALSFPGLLEPVELIGEVAWVRCGQADSPAGVGLRIPDDRLDDRQKLEQLLARLGAEPKQPTRLRTFRILLVEDNPHIMELYEYVMRKLARSDRVAMEVSLARDGSDALARVADQHFDLVITDLYMPVLDRFELIRRLRAETRTRNLPVVAISAGGAEAQAQAREAGSDVYLRKPVRFQDVLETVRSLLNL
jgi:uncharacterized protein (TIGR02266 family)